MHVPMTFTQGDFYFIILIIILELFSIFFGYLFSMLFLPMTFTHDPWPLPTTQDPQHLATLLLISFYFMQ